MSAVQHKDGDGFHWKVKRTDTNNCVDVWWSRTTKQFRGRTLKAEFLMLRQVHEGTGEADVIVLSLGQVYDLIDALNRAVMEP